MNSLIGQTLGHYHIVEQLGEGGMATVYKAYDTHLERDVAVKVIRTDQFAPSVLERILKRFEREAKLLAKLTHPNIVHVIDYGDFDNIPYLVMEYLPGGTLKQWLGTPMPVAEAAHLLLPVARALDYAHRQGMIHRDVKPSNILITADGEPMLTDFGIAKLLESEDAQTLTGTGVGMGTPEYMAPEQWVGKATPASDQYSLGVIFYEMITGRKPYTADTPAAILLKQANDPLPAPGSYVPGLDGAVEKFIYKAMAYRVDDRFDDMGAFTKALKALESGAEPLSVPVRRTQTVEPDRLATSEEYSEEKTTVEPPAAVRMPATPPVLPVQPVTRKKGIFQDTGFWSSFGVMSLGWVICIGGSYIPAYVFPLYDEINMLCLSISWLIGGFFVGWGLRRWIHLNWWQVIGISLGFGISRFLTWPAVSIGYEGHILLVILIYLLPGLTIWLISLSSTRIKWVDGLLITGTWMVVPLFFSIFFQVEAFWWFGFFWFPIQYIITIYFNFLTLIILKKYRLFSDTEMTLDDSSTKKLTSDKNFWISFGLIVLGWGLFVGLYYLWKEYLWFRISAEIAIPFALALAGLFTGLGLKRFLGIRWPQMILILCGFIGFYFLDDLPYTHPLIVGYLGFSVICLSQGIACLWAKRGYAWQILTSLVVWVSISCLLLTVDYYSYFLDQVVIFSMIGVLCSFLTLLLYRSGQPAKVEAPKPEYNYIQF